MNEDITAFVGLDVHKDSTAIAVAEAGRAAPRFVGTVGPDLAALRKALGKLGRADALQIVYEAGPCGYGLVRELRAPGLSLRGHRAQQGSPQARGPDQALAAALTRAARRLLWRAALLR